MYKWRVAGRWGSTRYVRPMTRSEARQLQDWVVSERWDEGEHDADVLYDIDPDGFWAILDDEGRLIGGVAAIAPDDEFGSASMLYLTPEARGQGMWQRTLTDLMTLIGHRLATDITVTVFVFPDTVDATLPWGFVRLHDEVRMVRPPTLPGEFPLDEGVIDARDVSQADVIAFDAGHAGRPREALWRRWLDLPSSVTAAVIDDKRIVGLGTLRPSALGHRIGPLYATDPSVAERLMRRLLHDARGRRVAMDVPVGNPDAISLANAFGFAEDFRTVRMVRGPIPDVPWEQRYATVMLHLD